VDVVGSYGTRNIVVIVLEQSTDIVLICLSSLLLSEFSCQGDSPTPVVYSPEGAIPTECGALNLTDVSELLARAGVFSPQAEVHFTHVT
jgi:hypothetical protein